MCNQLLDAKERVLSLHQNLRSRFRTKDKYIYSYKKTQQTKVLNEITINNDIQNQKLTRR